MDVEDIQEVYRSVNISEQTATLKAGGLLVLEPVMTSALRLAGTFE
jgi:hypothetical protein